MKTVFKAHDNNSILFNYWVFFLKGLIISYMKISFINQEMIFELDSFQWI